jgi:hypothetical protein
MDSYKIGMMRIKCLSLSPGGFMVKEGYPVAGSLLDRRNETTAVRVEIGSREL